MCQFVDDDFRNAVQTTSKLIGANVNFWQMFSRVLTLPSIAIKPAEGTTTARQESQDDLARQIMVTPKIGFELGNDPLNGRRDRPQGRCNTIAARCGEHFESVTRFSGHLWIQMV